MILGFAPSLTAGKLSNYYIKMITIMKYSARQKFKDNNKLIVTQVWVDLNSIFFRKIEEEITMNRNWLEKIRPLF